MQRGGYTFTESTDDRVRLPIKQDRTRTAAMLDGSPIHAHSMPLRNADEVSDQRG